MQFLVLRTRAALLCAYTCNGLNALTCANNAMIELSALACASAVCVCVCIYCKRKSARGNCVLEDNWKKVL